MLRFSSALLCRLHRSSNLCALAAQATRPTAACGESFLNTWRPAASSLLQPQLLQLTRKYQGRNGWQEANAAAAVSVAPPTPAGPVAGVEPAAEPPPPPPAAAAAAALATGDARAPAAPSHGSAQGVFPALQGAPPPAQQLLSGLPHLMDAFNQGLLRAAEGVPQDLANSLLPALGDNKSWGWAMGNHEMWFSPPKPLHYFSLKNGCDLYRGSRAGLQPAQTWRGPFKALSPCGPQQLQQQQQVLDAAGLDMPGHWQEVASATGTLRWYMKGGYECMKLSSNALVRQLVPLAADHFLLRAQHTKGVLRLFCVPGFFLQPPGAPPLLEQRLAPQLRQLAAGVPLGQPLAGTTQPRRKPVVHSNVAWYYPMPKLDGKALDGRRMTLPGKLFKGLDSKGCNSLSVKVQIVIPAATATAAAAAAAAPWLPNGGQHVPRPHQRRAVAAAAVAPAIFTDSHGVDWALVQQEDGLTLATPKPGYHRLQGAQGWRRLLGFWGDWHLYKAEAVFPRTIVLYLLPPYAFS